MVSFGFTNNTLIMLTHYPFEGTYASLAAFDLEVRVNKNPCVKIGTFFDEISGLKLRFHRIAYCTFQ